MSDEVSFDPIVHEMHVSVDPDEAFGTYVGRIGEWWNPVYTANPETMTGVTIQGWVGGRVFTTHSDLGELDWGIVQVCESPRLFVQSFWLAHPADHPSLVSIEFTQRSSGGSDVRLVHGGWDSGNVEYRKKYGDWSVLLAGYASLVGAV